MKKMTAKELAKMTRNGKYQNERIREMVETAIEDQSTEKVYKVIIRANGNPDHGQNPEEHLLPPQGYLADTIEECQKAVREFIEITGIGAGNWTGGHVYKNNEYIGKISYNGKYWPKGHPFAK